MKKLLTLLPLLIPMTTHAGDLTARFNLTLARVLEGGPPAYTDDFVLADAEPRHVRRFTEFSGDVSGRYIEVLSEVARTTGKDFPSLHRIVDGALKLQKPDGHFGDPFTPEGDIKNSDMAILWGNGRMLVGLMAYHRLRPDRSDVLDAAKKLGDFLVHVAPRLNTDATQKSFSDNRIAVGYICWTQTVEGLVPLARATNDARYRQLAEAVAARTARYPAQHSHGFACALRGIVDLHHLTGDRKYLDQVEREWQGILDSGNLLPQGALPEAFKPLIKRDEGCSEADWLRLNLDLWKTTGKPQYLDNAELTLFNEFSFNQFHTGDFGHHTLTATGIAPPSARAWWCCTFHGLRAFPDALSSAFRADGTAITYALPVDGTLQLEGLTLRSDSRLGQDASATIDVLKSDGKSRTLSIRSPKWSRRLRASLNQNEATADGSGDATFTHAWKPGDRVTVHYDLLTRPVTDPANPKHIAYFHGPWMLGVDEQLSPHFFDEPHTRNQTLPPTEPAPPAPPTTALSPFSIPIAHIRLPFHPGGYPDQLQTATLRPIAEQTTTDDQCRWELWFTPKQ